MNLLVTVLHDTQEYTRIRGILFSENCSRFTFHTPYLPRPIKKSAQDSKNTFYPPGSKMRVTGMNKTQLQSLWKKQGGLSAFRITNDVLSEMDSETRKITIEEMKIFQVSQHESLQNITANKKRKVNVNDAKVNAKAKAKESGGSRCFNDPNYLVFQVPLFVYSSAIFGTKLFPPIDRKQGISCDEDSTLICNVFFGMMGDLPLGQFLSWARKRLKRAPLPLVKNSQGKLVKRFGSFPTAAQLHQNM